MIKNKRSWLLDLSYIAPSVMAGRIRQLPASTRELLRSGISVTTAAQCLEELVLNSIDAKATIIEARVS